MSFHLAFTEREVSTETGLFSDGGKRVSDMRIFQRMSRRDGADGIFVPHQIKIHGELPVSSHIRFIPRIVANKFLKPKLFHSELVEAHMPEQLGYGLDSVFHDEDGLIDERASRVVIHAAAVILVAENEKVEIIESERRQRRIRDKPCDDMNDKRWDTLEKLHLRSAHRTIYGNTDAMNELFPIQPFDQAIVINEMLQVDGDVADYFLRLHPIQEVCQIRMLERVSAADS